MAAPRTFRMYIDGAWTEASSGATYALPNPATEETIGRAADGTGDDMRRAILAARSAFDEGSWRKVSRSDRARILRAIADGLERRKEELRDLLIAYAGCEYSTHWVQIDTPIELLASYADLAHSYRFEETLPPAISFSPVNPGVNNTMVVRQPAGVCGLIPTWNFPLFVSAQKIGPALAAGCTMVVKPSPFVPVIDLLLAEIIEQCDLPRGVFNVVTGENPDLGSTLVSSPLVDRVSFTGSVGTGKAIMAAAAPTLKRVHLELGGKSAAILLDDSQLDLWAMTASGPSFFHAGQGCAMCTRVLVPKKHHDALVAKMAGFVGAAVRVGDPADPGVLLGPVIRDERRRKIEEYIEAGRSEGATLATGGGRPKDLARGYFLEPTIFCGVDNSMRIAREEIFGPVVSVLPFDDEEDAIRIANDSPYGLGGAIYGADTAKALEMARRIRSGQVNVNGAVNLVPAPFGGFKESGIGREGGRWGLEEYTEIQTLSWK